MKKLLTFILAAALLAAFCLGAAAEAPDIIQKGKSAREAHETAKPAEEEAPQLSAAPERAAETEEPEIVFPEYTLPDGYVLTKVNENGKLQTCFYKNAEGKTIVFGAEYDAAGADEHGSRRIYAQGEASGTPVMLRFAADGSVNYALISIEKFDIAITANEGVSLEEMEMMLAALAL